jgi:lysophospholipase L1-like esterase
MKRFFLQTICFLLLFYFSNNAAAQQPAFWNEIQAFRKQDSITPPPEHPVLFVGSSSFRIWKDLEDDFRSYDVINRGFGGSTFPDLIRYADQVIIPYHPKQIFIYCGDNDLAASDTVTATMVAQRFQQLFDMIRKQLPKVPIVFVSIKPSPSRAQLMPKMEDANQQIKKFLARNRRTHFVDVYHKMLDESGQPRKELFLEDQLHMNKSGYSIWKKTIKHYLIK